MLTQKSEQLRSKIAGKSFLVSIFFLLILVAFSCARKYGFEEVSNNQLNVKIYTLGNGLKVYLSVNKKEPRIHSNIVVKVGSKFDPEDNTGLSHCLEHMMFKGTSRIGTLCWEKEKPLLDSIEILFEKFRNEQDSSKKKLIYRTIDSISYEASKFAIPNEYFKLMSSIGAQQTNATSTNDHTVYIENIPSNQLENWAIVQAERFSDPVFRFFHTELETIYEEKNRSLVRDYYRINEAINRCLFPNHPYGQNTPLGNSEHLKKLSIKKLKEFYNNYYVPNNMAIVLSGDLDPNKTISIIEKYFGKLEPKELPTLNILPEKPIEKPIEQHVYGIGDEQVHIGFRFPGASSRDALLASLVSQILFNGSTGLVDLNVNLKQKTYSSGVVFQEMKDYSLMNVYGFGKKNQPLNEVKDILLEQIELLKKGDFNDWLVEAIVNNIKLEYATDIESNNGRVWMITNSFTYENDWNVAVNEFEVLQNITKDEIVDFARKNINNNYAVVFKHQGKSGDEAGEKVIITPLNLNRDDESDYMADFREKSSNVDLQIEKPINTPIHVNHDVESEFMSVIKTRDVAEIEPVFVDYKNELEETITKKGLEIVYKNSSENDLFSLTYYFLLGRDHDKMLTLSSGLLDFIGTSEYSAAQIKQEFFKLACKYSFSTTRDETFVTVSGLSENQELAVELLEKILTDSKPTREEFDKYIQLVLHARESAKANQNNYFLALIDYGIYGKNSPFSNRLSEKEITGLNPDSLIRNIHNLSDFQHKVLYYGPSKIEEVTDLVDKIHQIPDSFREIPAPVEFAKQENKSSKVVFSHFDTNQAIVEFVSSSVNFSKEILPLAELYNTYFGEGMNSIVFQELREKRGLAFSVASKYFEPEIPSEPFVNYSYIATQNGKVADAVFAFDSLFNNIPVSENSFMLAKDAAINKIRNERISEKDMLWNYLQSQKMGYQDDIRKFYWDSFPDIDLDDIIKFSKDYIQQKPRTIIILGNEDEINLKEIENRFGPAEVVTADQLYDF